MAWVLLDYTRQPIESGSAALGGLCVFGLALTTALSVFTRRVVHDAAGICDKNFFRTRRVPWKAIASLRRVNLSEAAQKRYDKARKPSGTRPINLMVWRINDAAGQEILHFSEAMAPPEAFVTLRLRIESHIGTLAPGWPSGKVTSTQAPASHNQRNR